MVAPGSLASMPAASRAVVVEPDRPRPGLVDDEHAVGVAVEGQPDVEAARHHAGLEVELVGGLDGIGRVVRERAVELAVHHLELDLGQALEDLGHDEAAHAVGGVGHDLAAGATASGSMNDTTWSAKSSSRSCVVSRPGRWRPAGRRAVEHGVGDGLDVGQARVRAHRPRPGQAQLDAVVLRGVVRRGEHGARGVEAAGGEVDEVRRDQPEVDDVDALGHHAFGERGHELDTGRPHVAPDRGSGRRPAKRAKATPRARAVVGVELIGHRAPDVVGLDDLIEEAHAGRHLSAGGGTTPGEGRP